MRTFVYENNLYTYVELNEIERPVTQVEAKIGGQSFSASGRLETVRQAGYPITYLLLVDNSNSMPPFREQLLEFCQGLSEASGENTRFVLAAFGEEFQILDEGLTAETLEGPLSEIPLDETETHLHSSIDEAKLVEYAALAESASSHPISKSLQRAYGKEIDRSRVSDIREISGNGVIAKVDGMEVAAGNDKLMDHLGVTYIECHAVGTIIHMAIDGKYAGHIVISDIVKPHSQKAIDLLRKIGVKKTVMLTGDAKKVADQVGAELGLDEVCSELLPADKVEKVEELIRKKSDGERLAFVGDGINDAPVLGRADIGIAMGAMGSDAAIEAADVVLMDDDPLQIPKAIKISRKCLGIVYQNIVFAIGIKLICLVLGALGIANMWLAIFADVGVMIIAVLNAIRALFVKNL